MNILSMKVSPRENLGRRMVKKTRAEKKIPAVVYGHGIKPQAIEMIADDFYKVIHTKAGENVVIRLEATESSLAGQTVVIKELQQHPVSDAVEHVDFKVISLKDKIKVKVPLHSFGECAGIKKGGILDMVHHEIEVECLPTDIPDRLDIDISSLDIGQSIHLKDLKFSEKVMAVGDPEETIIAVHAPKAEEEPVVTEEAKAEPEVITKKKEEVEGAAEAPEGKESKS